MDGVCGAGNDDDAAADAAAVGAAVAVEGVRRFEVDATIVLVAAPVAEAGCGIAPPPTTLAAPVAPTHATVELLLLALAIAV